MFSLGKLLKATFSLWLLFYPLNYSHFISRIIIVSLHSGFHLFHFPNIYLSYITLPPYKTNLSSGGQTTNHSFLEHIRDQRSQGNQVNLNSRQASPCKGVWTDHLRKPKICQAKKVCSTSLEIGTLQLETNHTVGSYSEIQSWSKDYFKMKTFEIQQMQKETFSELPLSD